MKRLFNMLYLLLLCLSMSAMRTNMALHLDGRDNDVRTGIGILEPSWTLEAWIKGDDCSWKKTEVLFGGGEYSVFDDVDNLPLVISEGRLHCKGADLWSEEVLDDSWHHVAVSCDGYRTRLYLDGTLADEKGKALPIIPGAIGINVTSETVFGGLMDEVRIWSSAISGRTLSRWKNRPLQPSHPDFGNLVAYYNFDEGIGDMAVNWTGRSVYSFHLRNGRACYGQRASLAWQDPARWQDWMKSIPSVEAPLAYTVPARNPYLVSQPGKTSLFNAVVLENEWDVEQGRTGDQILKLRIILNGQQDPVSLTELRLDLSGMDNLRDIGRIRIFYAGKTPSSKVREEICPDVTQIEDSMTFRFPKGKVLLTPGVNYILVTADISPDASAGDRIVFSVPSFRIDGRRYVPSCGGDIFDKQIVRSRSGNPDVVKMLQWNIWNGGIHLGNDGQGRVIDLLKDADADIITMQEAYGAQQRIAESLGYRLCTSGPVENLALFSRFRVVSRMTPSQPFNSLPVVLELPSGRRLLVNSLWIRFAHNPSYSGKFRNGGYDVADFVHEDATRGLVDLRKIWRDDVSIQAGEDGDMAIVFSGDFNSGSHLDWTAEAARFHGGYGPVPLPISGYMIDDLGFHDSFRELHPDECLRHEGTFAVIYGQLRSSRIDYTYYRGRDMIPLSAKVVRTTYEIDDVWASDHAGYMTYFEIKP